MRHQIVDQRVDGAAVKLSIQGLVKLPFQTSLLRLVFGRPSCPGRSSEHVFCGAKTLIKSTAPHRTTPTTPHPDMSRTPTHLFLVHFLVFCSAFARIWLFASTKTVGSISPLKKRKERTIIRINASLKERETLGPQKFHYKVPCLRAASIVTLQNLIPSKSIKFLSESELNKTYLPLQRGQDQFPLGTFRRSAQSKWKDLGHVSQQTSSPPISQAWQNS